MTIIGPKDAEYGSLYVDTEEPEKLERVINENIKTSRRGHLVRVPLGRVRYFPEGHYSDSFSPEVIELGREECRKAGWAARVLVDHGQVFLTLAPLGMHEPGQGIATDGEVPAVGPTAAPTAASEI